MLDNRYALLFIRGERPVMDLKYDNMKDVIEIPEGDYVLLSEEDIEKEIIEKNGAN